MTRQNQNINYRLCFLILTVVFVPGIARAVDTEARKVPSAQFQEGSDFNAQDAKLEAVKPSEFTKPRLPANVIPARGPAVMPKNEKIRILPLTVARVPIATVFSKSTQVSVFKPLPVAQPAVSPIQRLAEKPAAVADKTV